MCVFMSVFQHLDIKSLTDVVCALKVKCFYISKLIIKVNY